jgi:small GTP-binding protein
VNNAPPVTTNPADPHLNAPLNSAEHREYQQAIDSVESTLSKLRDCPDKEREHLHNDISQLQDMYNKITNGHVEIVIFGEISTGKSALINALVGRDVAAVDVQGGWTKQIRSETWHTCAYRVPGAENSEVVLVDTPGINEVGGKDRAQMAETTARKADLILFVTDSDLNDTEYASLVLLAALQKPMILVFNKTDLYQPAELNSLVKQLQKRVAGLVPPDHFVLTQADPRKIEYVLEDDSGKTKTEWRKPDPDVGELKAKILQTFEKEGLDLIALNAAMYAADKSDRVAALRIRMRNQYANNIIWTMASTKAVVVALNPLPVVDVLGGIAIDALMIVTLSKVYGLNFSMAQSRGLAKAIGKAAGIFALGELTSWGASAFKFATGTLGTALTMIPQGAAAGFSSYIIGQASKHYFEHGGTWGAESPKVVVKSILAKTDKDSVLRHLKDEIRNKLKWNRHAGSKPTG